MKESTQHRQCRIAVKSAGKDLNSRISSIGRCSHILLFEGSPERFTVVENTSRRAGIESGVESAKALADEKIDIVITGTIGTRSWRVLHEAGISVKAGARARLLRQLESARQAISRSARERLMQGIEL
jgi:predicted Fe-Mo cluster-binding NifX family protein